MNTTSIENSLSILVTGGCGFIGKCLIERLAIQNRHYIRVLDNLSVGSLEDLSSCVNVNVIKQEACLSSFSKKNPKVDLLVGDIRDPETTLMAAKGIDVIIHLAANTGVNPSVQDPRSDMVSNVIGTFNMLEAARKNNVSKFIFASSGAPVGECNPPIHEELAAHPVSPYGASKLAGEGYCSAYYRTFGIKTIALRFGNVYGPGSGHKSSVIAKFIRQVILGRECEIYGDGSQTRDFIYIEDLVNAIIKAMIVDIGGEIFQIATNKEHTINEVVEILKTQLENYGKNMKIKYGNPRLGDVMRNYSDTSKALDMIDWKAATSLEEGILKTIISFFEGK